MNRILTLLSGLCKVAADKHLMSQSRILLADLAFNLMPYMNTFF